MSKRLPLVPSLVALAVALLGWTPAGEAAQSWVKRALYAKNAGKVNGIKASKTPVPGRLLALDLAGQFPASVLPQPAQAPTTDAYSVCRNGAVPIGTGDGCRDADPDRRPPGGRTGGRGAPLQRLRRWHGQRNQHEGDRDPGPEPDEHARLSPAAGLG